jgi:lysophospholipase L1-like esterase
MIRTTAAILVSLTPALLADSPIQYKPLYEPGCGGAIVSLGVSPHDSKHLISGGDMLGVATSFDGGDTWQSTFGFSSYEMATPTFHPTDPTIVWIGSCMGPYKSSDKGINWVSKRSGMPEASGGKYTAIVEKVIFDPDQPTRLLAVGGSSRRWNKADTFGWIWESTDDGESWRHLTTLTKDGSRNEPIVGGNIVWADYLPGSNTVLHAVLDGGAWLRSEDDGRSWTVHQASGISGRIEHVTFDPTDSKIVYVSTSSNSRGPTPGGVFKSTDGGHTFVASDSGITKAVADPYDFNTTSQFSEVVVSRQDPRQLYVCDRAWNASVVYKSTDAGVTWTPTVTKQPLGQTQNIGDLRAAFRLRTATHAGVSMRLTIDPNDASRIYGYNTEFVLRTTDAGKTWDDATAFNPDPDKPTHWRGRGWNGWCSIEARFNPYKPHQLIVQAMDAARAWISDDNGHSWHYAESDTHPWLGGNAITFTRDGHIYGTTGHFGLVNGITRSRDGGKTWQSLAGADRGLPGKGWSSKGTMGGIYAHPDRSSDVWAVVDGRILFSSNHGDNWTPVTEKKFHWIEPDPTNADRFYASANDGIYVTQDGKSFTNIGGPRPVNRSKMHVDSKGRLYAAQWRTGAAGVWRYDPSQKSWTRLLDEPLAIDVTTDPKDDKRIILVTSQDPFNDLAGGNGVWISADDGKTWSKEINGLAMLRANCVTFDPKDGQRFLVGTYGRGFFEASWPREYVPAGSRTYAHTDADTAHAAPTPEGHMVRNFGPDNFEYAYGQSWKIGETVKTDSATVMIEATEHGGAGLVLGGQNIAPAGQKQLVFRIATLEGNQAQQLSVNLNGLPGGDKTLRLPLPNPADGMTDVKIDLPAVDKLTVDQMQIQGNNFSDGAGKVRVRIDSIRTTGAPAVPAQAAAPQSSNDKPKQPLRNGDFEQGDDRPWSWLPNAGAKISRDTTTFKAGTASLKVTVDNDKGHGLQQLSYKAGDKLRVTGFLKSTGDVKANACVMSFKPNHDFVRFDQLKYAQNDSDWAAFDKTITLPEGTAFVQLGVMVEGRGSAWLDDVKVEINGTPAAADGIKPAANPSGETAPARGLPNTAAHGFYPAYPGAWRQTFKNQLDRAAKGNIDIVLLGDSITQGWGDNKRVHWKDTFPDLNTANFGIGGDSTRQVLYRIENGLLDGYKTRLVVLLIGTNNLYDDFNAGTDEQIADGIKICVEAVRTKQPDARIILLSLLPRQNGYFIARIDRINDIISKLDGVQYVDVGASFRKSNTKVVERLFVADELHLSDAGYDHLLELLKPVVADAIKK